MKHHKAIRKFGRDRDQRAALMRSLARAVILEGTIETTLAKAKEVRPFVERLVTKSKDDTVANRRHVASRLGNDAEATKKLFAEIAPAYKERPGGYLRIIRTRRRTGDASVMAMISFV